MAPSRIGNPPVYGRSAASGASGSGYDSLNRTRKKPKLYPGQAKPKPRRSRQPRADDRGEPGRQGAAVGAALGVRQ